MLLKAVNATIIVLVPKKKSPSMGEFCPFLAALLCYVQPRGGRNVKQKGKTIDKPSIQIFIHHKLSNTIEKYA
jgi:hypothetical protein